MAGILNYMANVVRSLDVAYLLAGITTIWLLATVCPFVSLHMILLDKTHVTLVTTKRLLSWKGKVETPQSKYSLIHLDTTWLQKLTTVDLLMSLEEVLLNEAHVTLTAPERPLTCAIKSTTIHPPHYLGLLRCYHSQIMEFTQRCSH